MIEIIQGEEEKEKGLPKEIRQIGNTDIGDRIYLGERVYQYLHRQTGWDHEALVEDRKVFVLLGRLENYQSQKCIFIEYAFVLEHMVIADGMPVWNDSTWGYVFKKMKNVSEEMIVVGWAMDLKGGSPSMIRGLTQIHMTHFGGRHQVLFLMDSIEKDENFFCNRQGELYMREGFYLYHDKTDLALEKEEEKQAEVVIEHESSESAFEKRFWEKDMPERMNLKQKEERKEAEEEPEEGLGKRASARIQFTKENVQKVKKWRLSPTYILAGTTLVLIFAAYRNNARMKNLQETISQMNVAQTMFSEDATEQPVAVETLQSNVQKEETSTESTETAQAPQVTPQDASQTTETQETQMPPADSQTTDQANTTEQALAEQPVSDGTIQTTISPEAKTYVDQGYYVVQKGDNLAGICMKLYQTKAMMDKVCEANGIDNPDEIYAGQCLTLPN